MIGTTKDRTLKAGRREKPTIRFFGLVALVAAALAVPIGIAPASAQSADPDWTYDLAIYGWAPGMSGTAGIGPVTGEVDESFSDILDNLELAGMGAFAATHGRWVILGDTVFAGLGAAKEGRLAEVDVDLDMLIVETDLGYAVADNFQLFGGARYVDLDTKTIVRLGPSDRIVRGGEAWVDPVVGARWGVPIGERFKVWLRGDVGGFGVGSDLTWNAVAGFGFDMSPRTSLALGYRVLDFDYKHGSGADRFLFNMQLAGPFAGLLIRF